MANPENKQIPYESTQQDIRDAIESVATAIGGIAIPSADHVSYDNSVSGLSATDVQNALDEIVSDIPTVNNGTLTIQQNGTSIGSFSANTASNVTANIKTPTADKKTATSEFSTANGGLLSKCVIDLVPVQSGSGDPYPAGGGKNKLANVLSELKSNNTSGTWSGNVYTINGGTIEILTDNADNILGYKINGTFTGIVSFLLAGTAYKLLSEFANNSIFTISQEVEASGLNGLCLQRQEAGSNIYIPNNQTYTSINPSNDTTNHYRPILRFNNGDSIANKTYVLMICNSADSFTFAPYSNIRPISGHTEVGLYNVGKNECKSIYNAGYTAHYYVALWADFYIQPNTTYTFSFIGTPNNILYSNENIFTVADSFTVVNGRTSVTLTTKNSIPSNQYTLNGWILFKNSIDQPNANIFDNFQIEKGNQATPYEPYLGHLYQVQIGSTVYGGTVDLISGVMTVDRVYCKLADQSLRRRNTDTSDIYRYAFAPNPAVQIGRYVNVISNALVAKEAYASYQRSAENCVTPDTNGNYINLYASDKQTDTAWITFATNNDVEIVYPLATPQTIQLTPQQIEALVGQNNLSTPLDGQSIETNGVEYKELFTFADVKEYVDKKIPDAPTTNGTYTLQAVVSGGVPTYSWV